MITKMTLESMVSHRPDLITADMDGDCVMMDPVSGKYFNIGSVGGRIWQLSDQKIQVSEIVSILKEEYDVSQEQCEEEVLAFLSSAIKKGIMLSE